MVHYNLSKIPGFIDALTNGIIDPTYEKYYNMKDYSTKSKQEYKIIRYNKDFLTCDLNNTYGLLRSVIVSNNKVIGFSPPKSLSAEIFINNNPITNKDIIAEDFIEGTMINVFFDSNSSSWQISTRNTVAAEVSFYNQTNKTFSDMFNEALIQSNLQLNSLNPFFCYSFVLQHPDNRIVVPFKNTSLYLVAVYEILTQEKQIIVFEKDLLEVRNCDLWEHTNIKFPDKYQFSNYNELIDKFSSTNTPYDCLGIMIKNKNTGERTKIRNPVYQEVKQLRGNQPKLMYQYLCLRHSGQISRFLTFYPETKKDMSQFRDLVHMFTETLHKNYLSCYVKKEKPLIQFPPQYRTHMFKIHEIFISELRPNKLFVTNTIVINYVNKLHPSLLMYCLNYNVRKNIIDINKNETLV